MSEKDLLSTSTPSLSASQPSMIEHPTSPTTSEHSAVESLPSSDPDSDDVTISDDGIESDAEREWKESLKQLELVMSMVLVPYMGKYFGRKFAFWGWKQFMEWKYPVEIVVTSKRAFRATGLFEAAASL